MSRGKSKIVVSYKSSEFTSNAILTGLRHQGRRQRNSMASFTLRWTQRDSLKNLNCEPETKGHNRAYRAQLDCSTVRSRPSAGAWSAKSVVSSSQLICRPLLDHRSIIDLARTTTPAVGNVCKFKASNDHGGNFRRAQRANPAGFVRDSGADIDRGARSWENRKTRIHGADLGARSAIQSGSDYDRSTSKPNKGIR